MQTGWSPRGAVEHFGPFAGIVLHQQQHAPAAVARALKHRLDRSTVWSPRDWAAQHTSVDAAHEATALKVGRWQCRVAHSVTLAHSSYRRSHLDPRGRGRPVDGSITGSW